MSPIQIATLCWQDEPNDDAGAIAHAALARMSPGEIEAFARSSSFDPDYEPDDGGYALAHDELYTVVIELQGVVSFF